MKLQTLFFLVCTVLITVKSFGHVPMEQPHVSYEVIDETDGIAIVQVTDGEFTWFQTIATITTFLLPKTAHGLCLLAIDDPKICDAVYEATDALISFKGRKICKGLTKGFYWLFSREGNKSKIVFEASHYESAKKAKDLFLLYKSQNIVKWENTSLENKSNSLYSYKLETTHLDRFPEAKLTMTGNVASYPIKMVLDKECKNSFTGYYYYEKYKKKIYLKGSVSGNVLNLETTGYNTKKEYFYGYIDKNGIVKGTWEKPSNSLKNRSTQAKFFMKIL